MKLGLITQVRDEIDIIRTFCSHADALFDRVYLVDHQSLDGTRQYLRSVIAGRPGWRYYFLDSKTKIQTAVGNFVMKQAFADGVDALFFVDADEFLLAPSRAALEASLAGFESGDTAGSITWKNCIRDAFEPPLFSFTDPLWVPPDESKFAKLVVPRSLYDRYNGEIRVTDGNHRLIHSGSGVEIAARRVGSMLHIPIRSRDQVIKKVILTVIAYRGYSLRIPGNAFQYYEMLEKIMHGRVSEDDLRGYTLGFETPNLGNIALSRADLKDHGYIRASLEELGVARVPDLPPANSVEEIPFERRVAAALHHLETDIPPNPPLVLEGEVLRIDQDALQAMKRQEPDPDWLIRQQRVALAERELRIAALEKAVRGFETSESWRLTRPLRLLMKWLRRK